MPEMYLKQTRFTYSACRPFTKNKERIQKFKETGDSRYIQKHIQTYQEKQLQINYCVIKHLILLKIQKVMDIKEVLLLWLINFLIRNLLKVVVLNLLLNKINN